MQITLLQSILIGIWSGLCFTGMLLGTFTNRCLVLSAGVGLVLGDLPTALLMGAVGELAFLGFGVSQGGSVPPNPLGPGIIGTIIAVTMKDQGIDPGSALALSFPFAVAIQFLITAIYTASTALTAKTAEAVSRKHFGTFRLLSNVTLIVFVLTGFCIGFAGAYSADGLKYLISLIPAWLSTGLGVAGNLLPAIGFAMILSVMVKKKYIPFVIIGYLAVAYLNLTIIGVAMLGTAVALLEYFRKEERQDTGGIRRGCAEKDCIEKDYIEKENIENDRIENANIENDITGGGRPRKTENRAQVFNSGDYRRTALRAYFLQSAFNYGNYEGTGYAYIMYPALRKFYKDDDALKRSIQENMEFMCTNPNFLPIITSMHLVMLDNNTSGDEIKSIKRALMGPLAGIGDSLVQFCIAPLFSTIGASLAQDGLLLGPVLFLAAMNGCLVSLKLMCCSWGRKLGSSIVESLHEKMEQVTDMASMIGVTVIAGLAVSFVKLTTPLAYTASLPDGQTSTVQIQSMLDAVAPRLLPALYTGFIFYLIKVKKWNVYKLVGITVILGILLSALHVIA